MRYEKKFPSPGSWASLEAQVVKNPPAIQKTWVRSLSWEDPMEESMAAHSSTLAWSGQRSLAGYSSWSRRVGHNRATNHTSGSPCHLSISHTSVGHIYHQAGQNTFRDSLNLTHTGKRWRKSWQVLQGDRKDPLTSNIFDLKKMQEMPQKGL